MVTACKCVERLCTGIVLCRIVSYRIVSYRIVSYRIVSYCIVLYFLWHWPAHRWSEWSVVCRIPSLSILLYSIPFHSDHLREYCNRIFCISMVFVTELYTKVLYCAVHRTYSKPVIQMSDRDEISIHLDLSQLDLSLKTLYRSGIEYSISVGASVRPTQQLQQHIRQPCVDFLNPKSIY